MHGMENAKYLKLLDDALEHATSEIFTYCYYSKFFIITSRFLKNILKQAFLRPTLKIILRYKFKRNIISMIENFSTEFSHVNKGCTVHSRGLGLVARFISVTSICSVYSLHWCMPLSTKPCG